MKRSTVDNDQGAYALSRQAEVDFTKGDWGCTMELWISGAHIAYVANACCKTDSLIDMVLRSN